MELDVGWFLSETLGYERIAGGLRSTSCPAEELFNLIREREPRIALVATHPADPSSVWSPRAKEGCAYARTWLKLLGDGA